MGGRVGGSAVGGAGGRGGGGHSNIIIISSRRVPHDPPLTAPASPIPSLMAKCA